MDKQEYKTIETYMLSCMTDAAHDPQHIYRVLYLALDIARFEQEVDLDILIAACLLHDIGRDEQFKDKGKDHAKVGAHMAYDYLTSIGWGEDRARHVADCVRASVARVSTRAWSPPFCTTRTSWTPRAPWASPAP
jgi:uncharacterized protein